mmetsp:Transcript_27968/g.82265  ORF Transcript_27968/g.82265 Transcript_27968/m.82265 type:complete len:307 (-) Transcript_27968:430-1350(-)
MDHVEPIVAVELLHRVVVHVPGPAEDLDGPLVRLEAPFRRPRLDNLDDRVEHGARLGVARRVPVVQGGGVDGQRECALCVRLLLQQHPLDVVVLDDPLAALLAPLGVEQRLVEPALAERCRPEPNLDPHRIHHLKHRAQPLVRLAHKVASRAAGAAAERPGAVRQGAVAHLLVEADHLDVVRAAVWEEVRDEEEGDASRPRRRVRPGDASEQHVGCVGGYVVEGGTRPHLVALEAVLLAERAVSRPDGGRADVAQRRPGVGLGQRHRADHLPGAHVGQVLALERFGAVRLEQVRRAAREDGEAERV